MTRILALLWLCSLAALAGCTSSTTAIRVELDYTGLQLDGVDVIINGATKSSSTIEPELLLLVDNDLAGPVSIDVWGKLAGMRTAHGGGMVTVVAGKTAPLMVTLTPMTCVNTCVTGTGGMSDTLMSCDGGDQSCPMGCAAATSDRDAHCIAPVVSNGIDPMLANDATGMVMVTSDVVFDTDKGTITGDLAGTPDGVTFHSEPGLSAGAPRLGVFVVNDLMIAPGATLRFTGAAAAVILAKDRVEVDGTIDVSAPGMPSDPTPAGPGGGVGGSDTTAPATGCGAGHPGKVNAGPQAGGGGGGGMGGDGGEGGPGGSDQSTVGARGLACKLLATRPDTTMTLEPLRGGSGGGEGGLLGTASPTFGGGGGGGLQITALNAILISGGGRINSNGAGGGGGGPTTTASPGGGAGAGGEILLEASDVMSLNNASVSANGGGGGGASSSTATGGPGQNGPIGNNFALGGSSAGGQGTGGEGGYFNGSSSDNTGPDTGHNGATAGGGGGASFGAIVVRGMTIELSGAFSPNVMAIQVTTLTSVM
jgi:hypothetical protein